MAQAAARRYLIDLWIPRERMLEYYNGAAEHVIAVAQSGERVRFPAAALRPFVTNEGVRGRFSFWVDERRRLERVTRA